MQKFLTIIIAVLMGYQIFIAKMDNNPSSKSSISLMANEHNTNKEYTKNNETDTTRQEMRGGFFEKTLSRILTNILKTKEGEAFFKNMIQPVNKPLADDRLDSFSISGDEIIKNLFHIKTYWERGINSIGPASCGHQVSIEYIVTKSDGSIIDSDTKTIILGNGDVIPALENIIVGMYTGEKREAVAQWQYAFSDPKYATSQTLDRSENYNIHVTLHDISPKIFIQQDVKIFDSSMAYKHPYLCGNDATFDVTISKIDGTMLYDSSKNNNGQIQMRLGNTSYPMIFSATLFGKIPVGSRVVLAHSKYLAHFATSASQNTAIFDAIKNYNEFVILEFKNFSK